MPKEKDVGGRPTKYKPEYDDIATKLCLLGYTAIQLAAYFDVNPDTIYEWQNVYPNFSESLKKGRDGADMDVVFSLYEKAKAGDTTAQIFWLKNRQSKQWRDKAREDVDDEKGVTINIGVNDDNRK